MAREAGYGGVAVRERHIMDPAEDRQEFEASTMGSRLKGGGSNLYERNALVRHLVH